MNLKTYVNPCWRGHPADSPMTHYLYLLVDANGAPLYVGRTKHLALRIATHRRNKSWWIDVDDIFITGVCCIDGASPAELRAIRDLHPLHNVDPVDAARAGWDSRHKQATA